MNDTVSTNNSSFDWTGNLAFTILLLIIIGLGKWLINYSNVYPDIDQIQATIMGAEKFGDPVVPKINPDDEYLDVEWHQCDLIGSKDNGEKHFKCYARYHMKTKDGEYYGGLYHRPLYYSKRKDGQWDGFYYNADWLR